MVCASYKEQIRKHDAQPTNGEAKSGSLSRDISDQFDFSTLFSKFPFLFLFPSQLTVAFWVPFLSCCISSPLFSGIQLLSVLSILLQFHPLPSVSVLALSAFLEVYAARLHELTISSRKTVQGAKAGGKGSLSYLVTRLRDSPLLWV